MPPTASDRRSSCLTLNILADHSSINRDGSFITDESATAAQMQVFNISRAVTAVPVPVAIKYATTGVNGTLRLEDLAQKSLGHHGRLSRGNLGLGNNLKFNRIVWDTTMARVPKEYNT
ncbi:hypothetical protein LZ32DRAFT_412703 [Colletotrichum eremochloae]|nr:hypothetical protein LZ32DRAFT_412703 [Colletotrichum eremochloae]